MSKSKAKRDSIARKKREEERKAKDAARYARIFSLFLFVLL